MERETIKKSFNRILQRHKAPSLEVLDYESAHQRFAYLACRDTLIDLGAPFPRADEIAASQQGKPWDRMQACVNRIWEQPS